MDISLTIVLVLLNLASRCDGTHFRGAMIYWKQSPNDQNMIDLDYRQAWRRTSLSPLCDDVVKKNGTLMSQGDLEISTMAFMSGMYEATASFDFQCTDYSIIGDWTSGKGQSNFTPSALSDQTNIFFVRVIMYVLYTDGDAYALYIRVKGRFVGCCWIDSIIDMGAANDWSLMILINTSIRSDTGKMNQSPRVDMPPILRLQYGCNHTIRIPVTDVDGDDIRCRWAEKAYGYDECGGACEIFTHATINEKTCTIAYGAQYQLGWYAVTVQIEDFSSASSNTILSSIPLQFLVSVENTAHNCETYESMKPIFTNATLPDKACIGVGNMTDFTTDIYIDSKANSSITELDTVSPIGLVKSSLQQVNATGTWHISVTWNPDKTDTVNNVFCFTAVDTNGLSSEQRCVTLLAGVPPAVILPSSKSPLGPVVPTTQHTWSIEFDQFVNAASRPAFIYLHEASGALLETVHVYNRIGVTYTNGSHGTVLHFTTTSTLEGGKEYYFLFGQGIAEGRSYCGAESKAELDPYFWRFTAEPNQETTVRVVCERVNDSAEVPCKTSDFNCPESGLLRNPCTHADILAGRNKFAHPEYEDLFLLCDFSGRVHIVFCPPGEIFNSTCSQCTVSGHVLDQTECGTGNNIVKDENPCTQENILAGNMFFPHPSSESKFIHCDIWGRPWEHDCPAGEVWDQLDVTCIVPTDFDPCKNHAITGQSLFPHCDPHKYIHCDGNGQSFVQSCQLDFVFLPTALTCVPPGFPGSEDVKNTCT